MRLSVALLCLGAAAFAGCRAQSPVPTSSLSSGLGAADLAPPSNDAQTAADAQSSACAPAAAIDLDAERDAVARDLAIDPDDPEKLAAAAELYLVRLPASTTHSEIGLLYARRGREQLELRAAAVKKSKPGKTLPGKTLPAKLNPAKLNKDQRELLGRLSLLEGEALLDLGKAREAIVRIDAALRLSTDSTVELHASYERAVALYELCQLPAAREGFSGWLLQHPRDESETVAFVHHHLGLTLELLGDEAAAAREFGLAQTLRPEQFPALLPIDLPEFRRIVDKEAKALPPASIADLKFVALEVAEIPELDDLTLEDPPLSPTLVGLYRGLPLGEEPSEPRTIVLYRRNLLRIVRSREELVKEVRTTLLHELGHLRGADEEDLRERGLE